jgi:uncharacterized membrane protein YcgQ (UPF0703/DUF1980 family)
MQIQTVIIQFPEITLKTRAAHKLRGYFGRIFEEHSPLLHNHYESGELRYSYPLVQYKVINKVPTLVALKEGAQLLTGLFLKIKELNIDNTVYPVLSKNIKSEIANTGFSSELIEYRFKTLWMGLNQSNHQQYINENDPEKKKKMLNRILTGNILSFFKGMDIRLHENEHLMTMTRLEEKSTKFKDKDMLAFSGSFVVNADLPEGVGLGKGVSRGFGTVSYR